MKKLIIYIFCFLFTSVCFAQNRVDSLKNALTTTENPIDQFDLLNNIVDEVFKNGNGNIDFTSCIQMIKIARKLNNDSLMAIGYNTAGNYFLLNTGDYSNALEYFFKGIPLAEKANDKRRLSSLYIDISVVYYRLNNPDEQIKYLRKANENLPAKKSNQYYFMLSQYQVYTGRYYLLIGKPDSALHYAQALNETNLHLKSPVYYSAAQNLLGNIYEIQGDPLLAEIYYKNALRIADSIPYTFIKLSVKPFYIDFLLKNNRLNEARYQAKQIMDIGLKNNIADVKRIGAGFLRKIYDKNQQNDSAYYYSLIELAMKDSVFSQDNINKMQSLAFAEQLRRIEQEGKRVLDEQKRKQNIQYALLALGIITFVIIFLALSRRHITNTKIIKFLGVVGLLVVFEFLNLLLHPFLERITHHNPILMLLALVCIAALLVPLHHKLEHWATHKLVEKNKAIRLAAAKKTIEELEDNSKTNKA